MEIDARRSSPLPLYCSPIHSKPYFKKPCRYTQLTEINIKTNPLNAKEVQIAVKTEADRVLKAITPTTDRLIVLDERGTNISSEEMADILLKASDDGCSSLVFAIGGPYGHGGAVREAAYQTVSLSKMVMNHQVANVVLLEQLYRAWTILKNEPYHH